MIDVFRPVNNKGIVNIIKSAQDRNVEEHFRIYDDGCWWVDIERHPYGAIRFWVGFNNKKLKRSSNSQCFVGYDSTVKLICRSNVFALKNSVEHKICSVYIALLKNKLIK